MAVKKILITMGIEMDVRKDVEAVILCGDAVEKELRANGHDAAKILLTKEVFKKGEDVISDIIRQINPDCVINFFEGFVGDTATEAEFARTLVKIGIPFTGNMPQALENCLDKHKAKQILSDSGVSVPEGHAVHNIEDVGNLKFPLPAFVKARCEDASIGIDYDSLVKDEKELYASVENKLKKIKGGLIVEEFLCGAEFNISYVGEYPYELVGISKLDYAEHAGCSNFLTYASKWEEGTKEYKKLLPRVVTDSQEDMLEDVTRIGREAGRALGCGGYFRVDMREKDGKLFVIDVNPNPDISLDSGFVRQAAAKGLSYGDVIEKIMHLAMARKNGE